MREERGLSQDELAEVLGVKDPQTVSAMENGARRVRAEELLAIVERLGVPLELLHRTVPARWRSPVLLAAERRAARRA